MKTYLMLIAFCSVNFLYADCEEFLTEADCGMHSECEWHADEGLCEDEAHDHVHCDELAQSECEESIYCEWHSDEGECENEDGGHAHEDCDGLDGDINSDDELNILDVVAVVAVILGNDSWSTECQGVYADINDDGILDVLDVVRMVNTILNDSNS